MGDTTAEKVPENMTGEQDDRESRRIRRELLRAATDDDDEALLDESEDEAGPTTRARSRDSASETPMETETEENRAKAVENPVAAPEDTATQTEQRASGDVPAGAAPPPPPPPPSKPGNSVLNKSPQLNINKISLSVVKAKLATTPSGVASSSQKLLPNSCSGTTDTPRYPCGEGSLFGQNSSVNGAYKAVFALRQSIRTNPSLDEQGGVKQETVSVGSFANGGDNRSSLCHFRSRVDRKQNLSFSFDPCSLLCSNCPSRGGHAVCGDGGGGQ
jgi:hypothetical protein